MANATHLAQCCTFENHRYEGPIDSVYGSAKTLAADKTIRIDIRRFKFPLPDEKEMMLENIFPELKNSDTRKSFNERLIKGIAQNYNISKLLKKKGVQSIVSFLACEENNTDTSTEIYLLSQKYTPIYIFANNPNVTVGYVVDMARRLFAICKDLSSAGIVHRNINPACIYYDENAHLALGGFDHAAEKSDSIPIDTPFLNLEHVAPDVRRGERGSLCSDAYSIASIMKSYFCGVDITKRYNGAIPGNVPSPIKDAIELGMSMDPKKMDSFRKALNKAYKKGKHSYWDLEVKNCYIKQLSVASSNSQEMELEEDELDALLRSALNEASGKGRKTKDKIIKSRHTAKRDKKERPVSSATTNEMVSVSGPNTKPQTSRPNEKSTPKKTRSMYNIAVNIILGLLIGTGIVSVLYIAKSFLL